MRIRPVNDAPVRSGRAYVLYWMVAARRARANFALERAVELAIELGRPLIVFEPLRVGHPWAKQLDNQRPGRSNHWPQPQ